MKKNTSIIYVNFSPYQNVGKILDYILENFTDVFVFTFDFHKLSKNHKSNSLKKFHKGTLISETILFNIPIAQSLVFLLLPLRSVLIIIQIVFFSYKLHSRFGSIDYYFTVNAFTAWVGTILKRLKLVNRTVFWVWDYYPPLYQDKIVQLMRWIYWQFDKISSQSENVVFLNKKLEDLRKDLGILPNNINHLIVPIGTTPVTVKPRRHSGIILGFIGVVKRSQGLDILFDNDIRLTKTFPGLRLEIIGSGPDLDYFVNRGRKSKITTVFHGFLSEINKLDEKKIWDILSTCDIGIALYVPEETNASYYGDPSKVKKYLSIGLPIITTNVYAFAKEIKKSKAGILLEEYKIEDFIGAVSTIQKSINFYRKNSQNLAKKYYYKTLYKQLFSVHR